MTHADLSLKDTKRLFAKVSQILAPKSFTALQIYEEVSKKQRFVPCGLKALDVAMRGGLLIGCISEVCGPPGIGKTQLCLSCCVQTIVQRKKNDDSMGGAGSSSASVVYEKGKVKTSVIYFDTEHKFDAKRLEQLATQCFPEIYSAETQKDARQQLDSLLSSVDVRKPRSSQELLEQIENLQGAVIANGVTLIILDSIAALARREALQEAEREKFIVSQSSLLKRLAERCGCVILATNQVIYKCW